MADNQGQTENLQSEVDSLKSDLHKIQSDLREITNTLWSMGQHSYDSASDTVHSKVEHSMEKLNDYVQKQPVTTVVTAFAAGLVVGKLFGRR